MSPRHPLRDEAIRLHLAGMRGYEIAYLLQVDKTYVWRWLWRARNPGWKANQSKEARERRNARQARRYAALPQEARDARNKRERERYALRYANTTHALAKVALSRMVDA